MFRLFSYSALLLLSSPTLVSSTTTGGQQEHPRSSAADVDVDEDELVEAAMRLSLQQDGGANGGVVASGQGTSGSSGRDLGSEGEEDDEYDLQEAIRLSLSGAQVAEEVEQGKRSSSNRTEEGAGAAFPQTRGFLSPRSAQASAQARADVERALLESFQFVAAMMESVYLVPDIYAGMSDQDIIDMKFTGNFAAFLFSTASRHRMVLQPGEYLGMKKRCVRGTFCTCVVELCRNCRSCGTWS